MLKITKAVNFNPLTNKSNDYSLNCSSSPPIRVMIIPAIQIKLFEKICKIQRVRALVCIITVL